MPIKHAFSSAIADGSDEQLIRPSNWNADHVGESAGVVPIGAIIIWSGAIANIPDDWALCDGILNSPGPDLRDKFIVGAKEDEDGVAKTNIEGSLKVTGGVTGHLHSGHAALSHSGLAISDHTGLTHSLNIADHPDLTHAALSHAALTITHPDHSIASGTHSHAAITLTHADHSLASFTGSCPSITGASGTLSIASGTHSHASVAPGQASLTLSISSQGTARTIMTGSSVTIASYTGTHASQTGSVASHTHASVTHTHAAQTITHPDHSVASFSGTAAAITLTHADHSFPSLSHQEIGSHIGTVYGIHAITQPADHGTAGTVTHAFTESSAHSVSAHDTVLSLPSYYALAFIQRMV
jgi:hypothetical protein